MEAAFPPGTLLFFFAKKEGQPPAGAVSTGNAPRPVEEKNRLRAASAVRRGSSEPVPARLGESPAGARRFLAIKKTLPAGKVGEKTRGGCGKDDPFHTAAAALRS